MNASSAPEGHDKLHSFGQALSRFEEALAMESHGQSILRDARIQRFEFCVELAWKAVKRELLADGQESTTPKHALKLAYAAGWLEDESLWLGMLADRNLSSHTYQESLAEAMEKRLPSYALAMRALHGFLVARRGST